MKYLIYEVSKDAFNNLTLEVDYMDENMKVAKKTFNIVPTITKTSILKLINDGCPVMEKSTEEKEKETACEAKITEMSSELNKEVEITKVEEK